MTCVILKSFSFNSYRYNIIRITEFNTKILLSQKYPVLGSTSLVSSDNLFLSELNWFLRFLSFSFFFFPFSNFCLFVSMFVHSNRISTGIFWKEWIPIRHSSDISYSKASGICVRWNMKNSHSTLVTSGRDVLYHMILISMHSYGIAKNHENRAQVRILVSDSFTV